MNSRAHRVSPVLATETTLRTMGRTLVNDVQTTLNPTTVAGVIDADSLEAVCDAVHRARAAGKPLAVCGGRHAMGGQQFCSDGMLLDTSGLDRVLDFERHRGIVEVEAGIQWPALLGFLHEAQRDAKRPWAIAQKQTGADRFSLGGSVSANVHGRGLAMRPLVADVESLVVVDPAGEIRPCSREQNPDLFRLVVGGYGLFGIVYSVRLRLVPRRTLERVVELESVEALSECFDERLRAGFTYGDFQFAIDPDSPDFLRRGIFSCYRPVADRPILEGQRALSRDDWRNLLYLAHTDKSRAFDLYTAHYLATSGQLYSSDAHQFADYVDGYHSDVDGRLGSPHPATEVITEIYVPRERLADFMAEAAEDFRRNHVDVIYGTIRLIEVDGETFLAWARERWACVIFNLHTVHTPDGLEASAAAFRRLIDMAISRGGSYYLTYHRWATRAQVEACYPQFPELLRLKRRHDPDELLQSDWYRHYRSMFAADLGAAA
jgi:FAD/FMN-containing dehydrogenase